MRNNDANAKQYRTKNLKNLLLGLIVVIPMACAASPMAEKEVREIAAFHKIEVGGLVNVILKQGTKAAITLRAYGIAMTDILTNVNDGALTVTTKGSHSGESISIEIIYTDLRAIKTSGSATIKTDGVLKADSLDIAITDAGDANLEVDVNQLKIDMRGNGNLKLKGFAMSQSLISHGGGGSLHNAGLKSAAK